MIAFDCRLRLGAFALDAAFESTARLTALWGPSGAGKSTVLNLVAGIERPLSGRITVDGDVLAETVKGIHVPAHKRRVGMVFQDGHLLPHLSVEQNLRYGMRFAANRAPGLDLDSVSKTLGLATLLNRRPASLSSGERQRVALGRALLAAPRLLLMDEPLAALDDARKDEILTVIERVRDEFATPILYVTHSASEVRRLASWVVALDAGKVVAAGPSGDVIGGLG